MTLVELLVAIAIIAVLVALLLPAIQSAREAARLTQCRNNLKNVGIALIAFHDAHRQFPCGGWGHSWVGVPERGTGRGQPGGWIYCLLPFVEEGNLHNLGAGTGGIAATEAYSERLQTPISLFVCPTRRPSQSWPVSDLYPQANTPRPFGNVAAVARSDYAINAGAAHNIGIGGPADLTQGEDPNYWRTGPAIPNFCGLSHLRAGAALKSVVDGAGKTYLAGEKRVPQEHYEDGSAAGDNVSLYAGYSSDLHRFAGVLENLKIGKAPFAPPLADGSPAPPTPPENTRFGSAHAAGLNMVYCDGSVALVAFDIDPEVHLRAGHRKDQGRVLESLQ